MAFYSDKLNVTFTNPSATDTFGTYVVEIYNSDTEEYYEIYRGRIFVFGGKDLIINLNDILENYKIDFSWLLEDGNDTGISRLYNYKVRVKLTVNGISTSNTIEDIIPFYKYENKQNFNYTTPVMQITDYLYANNLYPRYPKSGLSIDFNWAENLSNDAYIIARGLSKQNGNPTLGNITLDSDLFTYEKGQINTSSLVKEINTNIYYLAFLDYKYIGNNFLSLNTYGELSYTFNMLTDDKNYWIYDGDDDYGNPIYYIPWIYFNHNEDYETYNYKFIFTRGTETTHPTPGDPIYSTENYKYSGPLSRNKDVEISEVFTNTGKPTAIECYEKLKQYNDETSLFNLNTIDDFYEGFPYIIADTLNNYKLYEEDNVNFFKSIFDPLSDYGYFIDLKHYDKKINKEIGLIYNDSSNFIYYKLCDIDICPARFYIKWVDRMGGIQCLPFRPYNKYTEDLNIETIENQYREKRLSNIAVNSMWELCTDYFDEKYYPIYESMIVSPYVILYDTENNLNHTVLATDNSYEEKTFDNEKKLISFKVNLQLNHTQNITY